jgi:hypothetical protein
LRGTKRLDLYQLLKGGRDEKGKTFLGRWVWEKQEPLKRGKGRRAGKDKKWGWGKEKDFFKRGRGKRVKKLFLPGKIWGGHPKSVPLVNFTFGSPESQF